MKGNRKEVFRQRADYYYTEKDNCPFCESYDTEYIEKPYKILNDIKFIKKGLISWSQNYKCRSCGKLFTKHRFF